MSKRRSKHSLEKQICSINIVINTVGTYISIIIAIEFNKN